MPQPSDGYHDFDQAHARALDLLEGFITFYDDIKNEIGRPLALVGLVDYLEANSDHVTLCQIVAAAVEQLHAAGRP